MSERERERERERKKDSKRESEREEKRPRVGKCVESWVDDAAPHAVSPEYRFI